MNASPTRAKSGDVTGNHRADTADIGAPKSEAFPKPRRTQRAVKHENGLSLYADHVHMCRAMIIRIDDDPQPIKPKHNRHLIT